MAQYIIKLSQHIETNNNKNQNKWSQYSFFSLNVSLAVLSYLVFVQQLGNFSPVAVKYAQISLLILAQADELCAHIGYLEI